MSMDLERPLRHPDEGSPPLMSKRARWLVVIGFLLPGSAQLLAGNRRLGRFGIAATLLLFVVGIVAIAGLLLARVAALTVFTNGFVLLALQILLVGYAVLWLVLGFDTLRLTQLVRVQRGWRVPVAVLSVLLTIVPTAGAAWAASAVGAGRSLLGDLFSGAAAVEPVDGRYNILLLGTDAGEDREGMRPDSISLVSVDAETGQSVIVGLPRELSSMPFPEDSPMHEPHPNGFCVGPNAFGEYGGCLTGYLNGVYAELEQTDVIVESEGLPAEFADIYDGFYPEAAARGSSPGLEATKDAVTGATGLEVQFYVLVNMDAFSAIIDALGGVTINVQEALPIGGDEYQNNVDGWIEPGEQLMDGYTAQWYARSRYGSANGDYDRMARQRELQAAILAQMSPQNVLLRFQDIAAAGTELVETDIPESMLGRFVDLATKAKDHAPVDVELVPPAVDAEYPDYAVVQQLVADAVAAASPPDEAE
ncbi:LCP family protein [Leucobacter allii]|uniref:LCP family protein n=1 Tax=Leucobacter allii TaxID=2932247 RepID=A0ABY4FN58_9MICO|nr:LCP family protein [Leucobacter allii]UOQ57681.1 LCP family protein [Leucobacter allii]